MRRSMKLVAAGALLVPLMVTPAAAQRWSFGALGGANISTFGGSDAEGSKNHVGVVAGAQVVRTLNDNVALEVNALYSVKGAKATEGSEAFEAMIRYIELPLLLRISPSVDGSVRPFVTVGASVAARSSCTVQGRSAGVTVSADCDEADSEFKDVDFTAIAGAGIDTPLAAGTATLAVRYGYGLVDFTKSANVQNRAFSIMAGWRVPIGKR